MEIKVNLGNRECVCEIDDELASENVRRIIKREMVRFIVRKNCPTSFFYKYWSPSTEDTA